MVLTHRTASWSASAPVYVAIVLTGMATYALLSASELVQRALGKTGIHVMSRIMGLILATIAVQFVLDGLRADG
jgi:multiple antibiotic resistance protein